MRLLKKLLKNALYVVPRLILFSVFIFCFMITAMVFLWGAGFNMHPFSLVNKLVSKP